MVRQRHSVSYCNRLLPLWSKIYDKIITKTSISTKSLLHLRCRREVKSTLQIHILLMHFKTKKTLYFQNSCRFESCSRRDLFYVLLLPVCPQSFTIKARWIYSIKLQTHKQKQHNMNVYMLKKTHNKKISSISLYRNNSGKNWAWSFVKPQILNRSFLALFIANGSFHRHVCL